MFCVRHITLSLQSALFPVRKRTCYTAWGAVKHEQIFYFFLFRQERWAGKAGKTNRSNFLKYLLIYQSFLDECCFLIREIQNQAALHCKIRDAFSKSQALVNLVN